MFSITSKYQSLNGNIFQIASKNKLGIQAVIHFAGLKAVAESVKKPLQYWDVNFCGTRNLLEVMNNNKCHTLIFSSSATVYGSPNLVPISETAKINPNNPYGATKAATEVMLANLAECTTTQCPFQESQTPWKIARLRYFNPVGAHPSGKLGEDPNGIPNNLFPLINQVAIGAREKIQVYGNDWETIDGSGVRDYIHVDDLADGHLAALKALLHAKPQLLTLNLGSGKGHSVLEVINCFEEETQQRIPYDVVGRREGDIAMTIANPVEALTFLGWSTTKSLKDICKDSWRWQKNNPKGYN